jgi:hypothetical protein
MPKKPWIPGVHEHAFLRAEERKVPVKNYKALNRAKKRGKATTEPAGVGRLAYIIGDAVYIVAEKTKMVVSIMTLEHFRNKLHNGD